MASAYDLEYCDWDIGSEDEKCSIGSVCEWDGDEFAGCSTPLRAAGVCKSFDSCEWSTCELSPVSQPSAKTLEVPTSSSDISLKRRLDGAFSSKTFYSPSPLHNSVVAETSVSQHSWSLSKIMKLNGCQENCTREVHMLGEYDILRAYSNFAAKSSLEQRKWLFDYFTTNCPNGLCGEIEPNLSFAEKMFVSQFGWPCWLLAPADSTNCVTSFSAVRLSLWQRNQGLCP